MQNKSVFLSILLFFGLFVSPVFGMHKLNNACLTTAMFQIQRRISYQQACVKGQSSKGFDGFRSNKKVKLGCCAGIVAALIAVKHQRPEGPQQGSAVVLPVALNRSEKVAYAADEYHSKSYESDLGSKIVGCYQTDKYNFTIYELLKDDTKNKIAMQNIDPFKKFETAAVIRCQTRQDNQDCGALIYTMKPEFRTLDNQGIAFVESLGVITDYRRQGIATHMLSIVEDMAKKRGDIELLCLASVPDKPAVTCYQKFGFEKVLDSRHFNMSKQI